MKTQRNNLKKIINEHSSWILSLSKTGKLADFKNWNLDRVNLEMANLPFAKFQFASLREAYLSGVNFRQAELLKICLIDAHLDGADLEGANLSGGDLSFSKCIGANFSDANLEGANFEGANLKDTNFTRAILRGANFKGANLSYSEIIDANLEGADFKGANLEGVNFGGANLDKANLKETDLEDLKVVNTNLQEAANEDTNSYDSILNENKPIEIRLNKHNIDKTTLNRKSSIKSSKEDLFVELNAVNPGMIEEAIVDLIEKLKSNIQFEQIKAICAHKNFIESIDKIDFKNGDIVTHDGEVAFKLDFNITYNLSLLLNRDGKLINVYRSIAKQVEK